MISLIRMFINQIKKDFTRHPDESVDSSLTLSKFQEMMHEPENYVRWK